MGRPSRVARPAPPLPTEADLQLLFAHLNLRHFASVLPGYRIAYNERLTTVAGRISYHPPHIELSVPLLTAHPQHVEATLLHEMVHAWLHLHRLPTGHGAHFRSKMDEVGLGSIYHNLPVPRRRSSRLYVLSCPGCKQELMRRRHPGYRVSCAHCSPKRFDARYEMTVRELR